MGWLVAVVCLLEKLDGEITHTTAYLIKQETKDYGLDGYLLTIATMVMRGEKDKRGGEAVKEPAVAPGNQQQESESEGEPTSDGPSDYLGDRVTG